MEPHREESRADRVNTGGEPGNNRVKGGIEPLEAEAFKCRIKEGDRLYYYRPRRRGDGGVILGETSVIKSHGHIVTIAYHGVRRNTHETSMTWGETIQLNHMTWKQLARGLARMQKEMGIACSSDSYPEEVKTPSRRRINRKEYAGRVMTFRDMGITYAQISYLVGISASTVREIHIEGAKQNI